MFADKRSRSGRKPKAKNMAAYVARLEMELDLLKKFHTELCQGLLAKRDIGSLKTIEEDTKSKRCVTFLRFRELHTTPGERGSENQIRTYHA